MKPWLRFSSLILFSFVVAGGLFLSGVQQFAPEEAKADVTSTPWPPTATTGTHLQVVTFTASSTWIAPTGVSSVVVEAWGGGGGARPTTADAAGGGGAYARSLLSVTPGNAYWIQVGAGSASNTQATSTFSTTTLVAAPGWPWAMGAQGGAVASSTGDIIYAGSRGGIGGGGAGDESNGAFNAPGQQNGAIGEGNGNNTARTFPGGAAKDIGDSGARGLVRIYYSSTTMDGFPFVRGRKWVRGDSIFATSLFIGVPSSVIAGDTLIAIVGISDIAQTVGCSGWTIEQNLGYFKICKKTATGSDTLTATSSAGVHMAGVVYDLANVDSVSSTAVSVSQFGIDPPSLNIGATKKALWIAGADRLYTFGSCLAPPSGFDLSVLLPIFSQSVTVASHVSEKFEEAQTIDPAAFTNMDGCINGSGTNAAFTIAIAGLAAAAENPTTVNTATPSTGWSGGFSTWFNNNF